MIVRNGAFEVVPIDRLRLHPANPRRGDVAAIRKSIETNGFYGVVVAQKSTGTIIAGNHRYRAALFAGATEVPVLWLDVDDETARRILLADNRTNDLASYDDAELAAVLESLTDAGGLDGTGFDERDYQDLLAKLAPADDAEEATDQSDQLTYQWHIVVECTDEAQQVELLDRLTVEGFVCRAVVG